MHGVRHVIADYAVNAGLIGLWLPDLPALIRFHLGCNAHSTGIIHFSLGLYLMLIPAVPVPLQLSGYKKLPQSISAGGDFPAEILRAILHWATRTPRSYLYMLLRGTEVNSFPYCVF